MHPSNRAAVTATVTHSPSARPHAPPLCCSHACQQLGGCQAWDALCGNDTAVAQCTSPGPILDVPDPQALTDTLVTMCGEMCMPGCLECGSAASTNCTAPLATLAYCCYSMPGMCDATSGLGPMCGDPDVAATFPVVCTAPPAPSDAAPCP